MGQASPAPEGSGEGRGVVEAKYGGTEVAQTALEAAWMLEIY